MPAEPQRGFTHDEIKRRWIALQELMQASRIDALLLTTEPDVRYVSGFLTPFWQSPTRTWSVVLPATGEPVAVIASIGESLMNATPIKQLVTYASPHPTDEARKTLAAVLQQVVSDSDTGSMPFQLGVPMGAETTLRMPLTDWQWIQSQCSGVNFVDATAVVQQIQRIKSLQEVNIIRYVAQCLSTVYAELPNVLFAGMTEQDVFRNFKKMALDSGVDDVTYLVGGADNDGYRGIIGPPSARALAIGDVLILDSGSTRDGYYCDFDRNYSVGEPSQRVAHAHHVVWDATEAGLSVLRPGSTCQEVFHAMHDVMEPHSSTMAGGNVGRLGHGLGMQLTETPSFTALDQTVIETGMVLTLEPGYCYGHGQMMVHEENIVITESGFELLSTRAPRDIMNIPA